MSISFIKQIICKYIGINRIEVIIKCDSTWIFKKTRNILSFSVLFWSTIWKQHGRDGWSDWWSIEFVPETYWGIADIVRATASSNPWNWSESTIKFLINFSMKNQTTNINQRSILTKQYQLMAHQIRMENDLLKKKFTWFK